ncbi:hypothetical protein BKA70DRAFT_1224923 [Coprinopsis sp. MPI-PUGE-AT-0042]|nr:hypothetical protein BKA70DRAFT_1224923 [Coprinopsis sp. MPI-PUGE-AT-0042]
MAERTCLPMNAWGVGKGPSVTLYTKTADAPYTKRLALLIKQEREWTHIGSNERRDFLVDKVGASGLHNCESAKGTNEDPDLNDVVCQGRYRRRSVAEPSTEPGWKTRQGNLGRLGRWHSSMPRRGCSFLQMQEGERAINENQSSPIAGAAHHPQQTSLPVIHIDEKWKWGSQCPEKFHALPFSTRTMQLSIGKQIGESLAQPFCPAHYLLEMLLVVQESGACMYYVMERTN